MTSRILGVVREQVLASMFGAGDAMDAYLVAFRIPNLLRDLFAEGAMSAAFVPTFTSQLAANGKAAAWRLANSVVNALLIVTTVLVLGGMVAAYPLALAFAPEYAQVAGKLELTAQLARIMLPTATFVALAAAAMGMLNSLRHFFVPALAPAMFNVVMIATGLALVPFASPMGMEPITVMAAGTLLGGVAQFAIQWPLLRSEGFRYRPMIDWRDPGMRRVLLLMGPGTIGLAATQFNLFVTTILATSQGTGAVSWLSYAFRLMYLPIGLFGVSIATAVLPAVSRHAHGHDDESVRDTVTHGMSLMMLLNIPATVGLVVLAEPIVRLMFERNAFTAADTRATATALQWYAVGLIGYSVVRITSPTFYALGQNRTPVIVSVATVAVNATLSVLLARSFGYAGLALGTSLAALFNAGVLLVLLRRRLGGLNEARLLGSFLRISIAAVLMGAAAAAADRVLTAWLPDGTVLAQIARVGGAIGAAIVVLAAAASVLRIREFDEGVAMLTRRLGRPAR